VREVLQGRAFVLVDALRNADRERLEFRVLADDRRSHLIDAGRAEGRPEGRATGFLLPTYGNSTIRGQTIHNAFFWAINRSQDATVLHDWSSKTGQGLGASHQTGWTALAGALVANRRVQPAAPQPKT